MRVHEEGSLHRTYYNIKFRLHDYKMKSKTKRGFKRLLIISLLTILTIRYIPVLLGVLFLAIFFVWFANMIVSNKV